MNQDTQGLEIGFIHRLEQRFTFEHTHRCHDATHDATHDELPRI